MNSTSLEWDRNIVDLNVYRLIWAKCSTSSTVRGARNTSHLGTVTQQFKERRLLNLNVVRLWSRRLLHSSLTNMGVCSSLPDEKCVFSSWTLFNCQTGFSNELFLLQMCVWDSWLAVGHVAARCPSPRSHKTLSQKYDGLKRLSHKC